MASKVRTIRQVAWISLLPQLLILGILILLCYHIDKRIFILMGVFIYMILFFLLRTLIARDHGFGIKNVKTKNFKNAIIDFERSYRFFTKYGWVDKYRYLILLSSSRMSYREMALINMAFCYRQIGHIAKSREFYEKTLKEFPESKMAQAGLRSLNSIKKEK